jgi:hypothetical protein
MNRAWLKAGLLGGGVLVLLNLIGVIPLPLLGCLVFILELVAFIGVGALAARWLPRPYTSGRAAGEGAVAGLLMGVIGALVSTLLAPLGLTLSGGSNAILKQFPPETLQQLEQAGIDPGVLFGGGTAAGITALCCFPLGAIFGAALGALGGLIYASVNPATPTGPDAASEPPLLPPEA